MMRALEVEIVNVTSLLLSSTARFKLPMSALLKNLSFDRFFIRKKKF